ncbi:hypothetical protein HOM50_00825 [bacterium]|jgi:FMN phosphatase YigB (HAD superfamily)|nr:hypothetical protein [bacterium]MBT5014934.1 hypothetical protein [bacterium]
MTIAKKVGLFIALTLALGFTIHQIELRRFFPSKAETFHHPSIETSSIQCPATSVSYTPDNTVFLVDFHYVIAQMDWKEAWSNFSKHPNKFKVSMRLVSYLFKKVSGFKNDKESILERYLNKNSTNKKYLDSNTKLINSYKLDHNTVELLRELKQKGYKLFFFSDMLPETLAVQKERQPELFKLFYAINIRAPQNDFASKLTAERYIDMKEFVTKKLGKAPEHYLFLDDKKANAKEAYKAGICSIIFTTATQAEKVLRKLKIL